jgi:hypothetical protein
MEMKKKRGRPKGSRNKKPEHRLLKAAREAVEFAQGVDNGSRVTVFEVTNIPFLSRLEAATVQYEKAIYDAIRALKGNEP